MTLHGARHDYFTVNSRTQQELEAAKAAAYSCRIGVHAFNSQKAIGGHPEDAIEA